MSKDDLNKNLQDSYLHDLIKNKALADINLINGIILTGTVIKFDNFSILIKQNNKTTLIYKHSISYIFTKNKKKIKNNNIYSWTLKCYTQIYVIGTLWVRVLNLINEVKMNFRPLHDRVMVKRESEEDVTKGGIIIPDTAKEKPMQAKVVAVGSGQKAEDGTISPLDVKKGDKVLIGKWSGTEVTIDNIDYVIVKESDIMGIVN